MLVKIRSKYIIKEIFNNMKNKRKLNIIKYNKKILGRLNINKEQFENYITLKEFNNKYYTNIEDIDLKELNLSNKNIDYEGLKDLVKIKFKELNKLNLSENEITDINILERVNYKKLKELNLSYNQISDINILEKVNFHELEKLNLSYNQISDINLLKKVKFPELIELNLAYNRLSNLNVLKKANFKALNILNLSHNQISDITIFKKVNFMDLYEFNLSCNQININSNTSIIKHLKSRIKKFIYKL